MRPVTLGLLSTAVLSAALTAGVILIRQPRDTETAFPRARTTPAGEATAGPISLERLRASGY